MLIVLDVFFFRFPSSVWCVHRSDGRWMYLVNMCIYPVLRYSERDAFNDNDLSIEVVPILYFCSPFSRLFAMVFLHNFCLVVVCRLLCLFWYSCLLPSLLLLLTEINSLNPKLIVATIPKMHSKLIEPKSFFFFTHTTKKQPKESTRKKNIHFKFLRHRSIDFIPFHPVLQSYMEFMPLSYILNPFSRFIRWRWYDLVYLLLIAFDVACVLYVFLCVCVHLMVHRRKIDFDRNDFQANLNGMKES